MNEKAKSKRKNKQILKWIREYHSKDSLSKEVINKTIKLYFRFFCGHSGIEEGKWTQQRRRKRIFFYVSCCVWSFFICVMATISQYPFAISYIALLKCVACEKLDTGYFNFRLNWRCCVSFYLLIWSYFMTFLELLYHEKIVSIEFSACLTFTPLDFLISCVKLA